MSNKRVDYKKIITKKQLAKELILLEPLLEGEKEYQVTQIITTLLNLMEYHIVIKDEVIRLKGFGDITTKKYRRKITRGSILLDPEDEFEEEVRDRIRFLISRSLSATLKLNTVTDKEKIKNFKQIIKNKSRAANRITTKDWTTAERNFFKLLIIDETLNKKRKKKWKK